jgi:hypothetical protein
MCLFPPAGLLNTEDAKDGGWPLKGRLSMLIGRTAFACSRQESMERLAFADSRKMRPRSMLRQPMEKRKKAETRVKGLVWCERMVAPILVMG